MFGGKCFGQAAVSFDAGKCENFGKLDILKLIINENQKVGLGKDL